MRLIIVIESHFFVCFRHALSLNICYDVCFIVDCVSLLNPSLKVYLFLKSANKLLASVS